MSTLVTSPTATRSRPGPIDHHEADLGNGARPTGMPRQRPRDGECSAQGRREHLGAALPSDAGRRRCPVRAGYQLTPMKRLYQDTDFAANETVAVVGPRQRMIPGVRILGPCRKFSQVELAFTDAISLGIDVPVRLSGDIEGTPGCLLIGPKGSLVLPKGRDPRRAARPHGAGGLPQYYGVKHLDRMNMRVERPCPTTLEGLLVRTHPDWKLEVHIDTDEANCCDLPHATRVTLLKA